MRPKRLISLLVAVCMMITMLPLSAVTAFAADTSTDPEAIVGDYKYAYTVNAENGTATITKFLGPVDPANNGPYDIEIPTELDHHPVTGLGEYSFAANQIQSVTIRWPLQGNPLNFVGLSYQNSPPSPFITFVSWQLSNDHFHLVISYH